MRKQMDIFLRNREPQGDQKQELGLRNRDGSIAEDYVRVYTEEENEEGEDPFSVTALRVEKKTQLGSHSGPQHRRSGGSALIVGDALELEEGFFDIVEDEEAPSGAISTSNELMNWRDVGYDGGASAAQHYRIDGDKWCAMELPPETCRSPERLRGEEGPLYSVNQPEAVGAAGTATSYNAGTPRGYPGTTEENSVQRGDSRSTTTPRTGGQIALGNAVQQLGSLLREQFQLLHPRPTHTTHGAQVRGAVPSAVSGGSYTREYGAKREAQLGTGRGSYRPSADAAGGQEYAGYSGSTTCRANYWNGGVGEVPRGAPSTGQPAAGAPLLSGGSFDSFVYVDKDASRSPDDNSHAVDSAGFSGQWQQHANGGIAGGGIPLGEQNEVRQNSEAADDNSGDCRSACAGDTSASSSDRESSILPSFAGDRLRVESFLLDDLSVGSPTPPPLSTGTAMYPAGAGGKAGGNAVLGTYFANGAAIASSYATPKGGMATLGAGAGHNGGAVLGLISPDDDNEIDNDTGKAVVSSGAGGGKAAANSTAGVAPLTVTPAAAVAAAAVTGSRSQRQRSPPPPSWSTGSKAQLKIQPAKASHSPMLVFRSPVKRGVDS